MEQLVSTCGQKLGLNDVDIVEICRDANVPIGDKAPRGKGSFAQDLGAHNTQTYQFGQDNLQSSISPFKRIEFGLRC